MPTAYARTQWKGNVATTVTLTGAITATSTAITISDGSTFPDASVGPFVVTIDQGTASEEKILVTSRTGNNLTTTLANRGYDNTTAAAHNNNAPILHTIAAAQIDEFNQAVVNTLGRIAAIGDILYASTTTALAKLGIGTNGQGLIVSGGLPAWGTVVTSLAAASSKVAIAGTGAAPTVDVVPANFTGIPEAGVTGLSTDLPKGIVTAKGDLIVATASGAVTNLPVGSNNQVLTADSTQTDGVKWAAIAAGITVLSKGTNVVTTNTVTETNLFDYAMPGATVVTGNVLRVKARGRTLTGGSVIQHATLKFYFGASPTLLWTSASINAGTSGSSTWDLETLIAIFGATSQDAVTALSIGSLVAAGTLQSPTDYQTWNAPAEAISGTIHIKLTNTEDGANAGNGMQLDEYTIELL